MQNIQIGVHGQKECIGGVYNMLSSFGAGLHNAFWAKGVDVKYTQEWIKEDIMPQFLVGFNASNLHLWDKILEAKMFNIMWTVDSVFYNNFFVLDKYRSFETFSAICLSDDDEEAMAYFMPDLQRNTLPLAIDPQVWYSENKDRPRDIVFLASIEDPEEIHDEVKKHFKNDRKMYCFYRDMFKYALEHPEENFWQIYNKFNLLHELDNSTCNLYAYYLSKLTYAVSYQRRINLVNVLSDFNVEVYGNGPWDKFLKGKAVHKGSANLDEAVGILSQAKIAFNLQPMQILNGIHDRIMNSSAAGALVFTDKNKMIYDSYGDSLCYFDALSFEGLFEQVQYYLENDEAREEKAKKAQDVTLKHHTWKNRADALV